MWCRVQVRHSNYTATVCGKADEPFDLVAQPWLVMQGQHGRRWIASAHVAEVEEITEEQVRAEWAARAEWAVGVQRLAHHLEEPASEDEAAARLRE